MNVTAIKTPILQPGEDLYAFLQAHLPQIPERSILVLASKIISTAENRFVPKKSDGDRDEKHALVRQEADLFIDPHTSKYDIMLTVKNNWIFANAGIDESNANNQYLLWPKDPQASASAIWQWLRQTYTLKEVGVTISDSSSMPLNWGVTGHAIAYAGFNPLKSYINTPDLHGRLMKMEQVNVMQSVTTAAVFEMGEGAESTPLGLVTDLSNIEWQDHAPIPEELAKLKIEIEDDVYYPIMGSAPWQKGGSGR